MCRECKITVPIDTKKCSNCGTDIVGPAAKIIVGVVALLIIVGIVNLFNNIEPSQPVLEPGTQQEASTNDSPKATEAPEPKVDNSITYEVVTNEDYGVGLKNHSYRVIINEDASDAQLIWVFAKLDDSKYEEVTVWFYKNKASVELGVYDVAMIERAGKDSPKITR